MFIVELFTEYFWQVATASVSLIVPVFAIILIFKILSLFLLRATD